MKNLKLSLYTSALFIFSYLILSVVFIPLLVKQFAISILDNTYINIANEAKVLGVVHENTIEKKKFPEIAQSAIVGAENDNAYLSIINWTGNIVCFPDVTKIGETLVYDKGIDFGENINGSVLYDYFYTYFNTLKSDDDFEIVNLSPIKNSDLIMVFNLNLKEVTNKIASVKGQAYLIFVILGLLLLIVLLTIVRVVNNYSEKALDEKIINLEYNAQSLAKLNQSISSYQERIAQREKEEKEERKQKEVNEEKQAEVANASAAEEPTSEEVSKQRILTYVRNELVSTRVTDIAYIYVESTITYIIRHDGRKTTSGDSLDKIYSMLKKEFFFKANRQFIVAISAIEKITKYENSKLKIQVKPKSEIDIIIGKNKASAFKQWLDL